jgi:hypothetical protein
MSNTAFAVRGFVCILARTPLERKHPPGRVGALISDKERAARDFTACRTETQRFSGEALNGRKEVDVYRTTINP